MYNIFSNIKNVLKQSGAEYKDIVRVRCYLVDVKHVEAMSRKLHQYLSKIRPTNTTVIAQLAAEGALIEIEVTALKRKK